MLEGFVHDVSAPPELAIEVQTGPAFELLIGLSTLTGRRAETESWVPELEGCSPALNVAVAAVGLRSGELWLHLLGLAIERPTETAAAFVAAVENVDPFELRRHLLGLYVPAWQQVAGAEAIERAAVGDADAAQALVANDRYYAGNAADALSLLLPLSAAETRRRVIDALRHFANEVFAPVEERLMSALSADADAKRALAARFAPHTLIAAAASGFSYEPEPEASRVILVPHLAARPWLLLCQHRDMRIICYAAPDARERDAVDEQVLALGRALGDAARIQILRRLVESEASLTELADLTGLVKSTAHHHLARLRAAGLVTVSGNARAYRYGLTTEAAHEISMLLARFLGARD